VNEVDGYAVLLNGEPEIEESRSGEFLSRVATTTPRGLPELGVVALTVPSVAAHVVDRGAFGVILEEIITDEFGGSVVARDPRRVLGRYGTETIYETPAHGRVRVLSVQEGGRIYGVYATRTDEEQFRETTDAFFGSFELL
jgi:hypothetical protein